MTRSELILVAALITLVLLVAAGLYDHYLNKAKVRQVTEVVHVLSQAAAMYCDVTGDYPRGRADGACDPVLAAMQRVPAPVAHIQSIDSSLLFLSDGKLRCTDPWGKPLRYLSVGSEPPEHRRRVETNGRIPIFESAGPDRDFGDDDSTGQADNIASDDPNSTGLVGLVCSVTPCGWRTRVSRHPQGVTLHRGSPWASTSTGPVLLTEPPGGLGQQQNARRFETTTGAWFHELFRHGYGQTTVPSQYLQAG